MKKHQIFHVTAHVHTNSEDDPATEFTRNQLLQSIHNLFEEYDIGSIAGILHNLSYLISTPGEYETLSKSTVIEMLNNAHGLSESLSKVFAAWHEYRVNKE